jgi:hypothetical protein
MLGERLEGHFLDRVGWSRTLLLTPTTPTLVEPLLCVATSGQISPPLRARSHTPGDGPEVTGLAEVRQWLVAVRSAFSIVIGLIITIVGPGSIFDRSLTECGSRVTLELRGAS